MGACFTTAPISKKNTGLFYGLSWQMIGVVSMEVKGIKPLKLQNKTRFDYFIT